MIISNDLMLKNTLDWDGAFGALLLPTFRLHLSYR